MLTKKTVKTKTELKTKPIKTRSTSRISRTSPAAYDDGYGGQPRSFRQIVAEEDPKYYEYEKPTIRGELGGFFNKKTFLGFRLGTGIIMVLIYTLALAAGYYYFVYNRELNKPAAPAAQTTQSVQGIHTQVMPANLTDDQKAQTALDALSAIYNIPSDKPTAIVVQDVATLKTQNPSFYQDAQNGDWVFLFKSNLQAVLYRYEENKVITISAFTYTTPEPSLPTTIEPTPPGRD